MAGQNEMNKVENAMELIEATLLHNVGGGYLMVVPGSNCDPFCCFMDSSDYCGG